MGLQFSRFNIDRQILQNNAANKRNWITGSLIFRKLNRNRPKVPIHGDHETHVSDGAEGDLHIRNEVCKKNPGHTKFIPVDTFTLKHLPKSKRDKDLYQYLKATADLTVKVNVKMTSPHRPEFRPKTNQPYPFYNTREEEVLRTGSGMVHTVYKYTHGVNQFGGKHYKRYSKCPCTECEHKNSPCKVWWEFYVSTAAHVVFDGLEASQTNLRLFYDNKDSPVVIVKKGSVEYINVEYDRCVLKYVTCEKNLGDKLMKMWKHYDDVWEKVKDKYKKSKLTFIVSHPHGCTKQVSIGYLKMEQKLGKVESLFTYTTCTCPGSSGARVFCVGYKDWGWGFYNGLVHSGAHSKPKYNYSAVSSW